jgi:hypothetical protein
VRADSGALSPAVNTYVTLATMSNVAAGNYVIFAKAVITGTPAAPPPNMTSQCQLLAGGTALDTSTETGTVTSALPGGRAQTTLNLQAVQGFTAAATVTIQCRADVATWSATNISIIAVNVGNVSRANVTG